MTQAEIYLTSTVKTLASTADQLEGCIFAYQALVDLLNKDTTPRPVEVNHDKELAKIELTFGDGSTLKASDPFHVGSSSVTSLSPEGYTLGNG